MIARPMGDPFRALADPTRRLILDELARRDDQTLFEICGRLASIHGVASTRQAISQHLDVLEGAGLVVTRREGRWKFHRLNPAPLETMLDRWRSPAAAEAAVADTTAPTQETDDANQPREHLR
jgi:DNA-binding transcriptional ArsR family regulator